MIRPAQRSPVLVVGAARSGTNLLSRILDQDERFLNTSENRYIWNYGQASLKHDVREASDATPAVASYIRKFFARASEKSGRTIIDKTISNTFRVPFLHEVFPESPIIHLIRDGRDNVVSRRIQWFGGTSSYRPDSGDPKRAAGPSSDRLSFVRARLSHLFQMLGRGNLPPGRWWVAALDNAWPFLANLVSGRPRRYGERFAGLADCLAAHGVLVTAGIQWRESVMQARTAGRRLPAQSYLELAYEDLLRDPVPTWERIAEFLEIPVEGPSLDYMRKTLRPHNEGKWRGALTSDELARLEPHIRPTLEFLGYRWE